MISRAVTRRVAALAAGADLADIDGWWERAGPGIAAQVAAGHRLTATTTAAYHRRHGALEGHLIEPERATLDVARLETSLLVTGPVAFKTHIRTGGDELSARRVMIGRLQGSATRQTLAGARDTTTLTALSTDQIAGYRRVTAGTPCPFCAMVASRGAVYKERTALGRPEFHDNDRCTYEPLYQTESEPPSVLELRAQWEQTTSGLSGVDALNAFRRARQAA